jgi:uncharacterized membrane protein YdjX (TVP38/TMEM64 family)
MTFRRLVLTLWLAVVAIAVLTYVFQRDAMQQFLLQLSTAPPVWAYTSYLILGCLRGFTLVPATYLLLVGLFVLPPLPLFGLTLVGIVVSSAAVYTFAERMRLDRYFESHYPRQVARLRALLARRELPIVIAWSFFPIAPTDLICYVCGALRVDLKKCLFGVTVGEGAICAVYVFLGAEALHWLR